MKKIDVMKQLTKRGYSVFEQGCYRVEKDGKKIWEGNNLMWGFVEILRDIFTKEKDTNE